MHTSRPLRGSLLAMASALALTLAFTSLHAVAAPPPAVANVGDADSYGKRVIWIGMAVTGNVSLRSDCTPDPTNPLGPNDRCVVLSAAATTPFNFVDLGSITLPAYSANSLICHWATANVFYRFSNPTTTASSGSFNVRATYRLESTVLNDPALVNPLTGLPFGGGIDVSISGVTESRSLAPGEFSSQQANSTRTCIAGLLSKSALMRDYGLSEAQAKNVFQGPITIRVGMRGSARGVSDAFMFYSTRFTADEK